MAIKISYEKTVSIRKVFRILCRMAVDAVYWGCIAAVAYVVGQILLLASFRIPSDSMQPGLVGGDYALVCS
jgi:signal peptidase I